MNKINGISNERDRSIILFLLNTGLRASEFINLDYEDVFEDIQTKVVKDEIKVVGKGNKERTIPLNATSKQAALTIHQYNINKLNIRINTLSPLILTQKCSRMSRRHLQNIVNENLNTNVHTLRHTCFTEMRRKGVKGEIIQKIAGHESYETTVKYYISVSKNDLIDSVNAIDTQQLLKIANK